MLSVAAVLVQKRVQFVSACCCIAGYVHKMDRPRVWSCDGSTFYKSWNTTLYYKNEAYVCGFVGMEVNKDKAFEVWHRRPDLDLTIANNDVSRPEYVAIKSPTSCQQVASNDASRPERVHNPQEAAMQAPARKTVKKEDKPQKAAMKSPAMKTVKKPMKRSK
jgi:hypothetical protein